MEKLPRPTTPEMREDIKQMTRASLRKVKSAKFALVTRYSEGELSKFGSDALADEAKFMPVDVLADLQLELPRGVAAPLLEKLAAIGGFRLVPVDDGDEDSELQIRDVQVMIKEGGEAKAAALAATGASCLTTVRTARREVTEAKNAFAMSERKLANQERGLLGRSVQ